MLKICTDLCVSHTFSIKTSYNICIACSLGIQHCTDQITGEDAAQSVGSLLPHRHYRMKPQIPVAHDPIHRPGHTPARSLRHRVQVGSGLFRVSLWGHGHGGGNSRALLLSEAPLSLSPAHSPFKPPPACPPPASPSLMFRLTSQGESRGESHGHVQHQGQEECAPQLGATATV